TPQKLAAAGVAKMVQTTSGEIAITPESVDRARMYEIHHGPVGPGGAAPTSWTTIQVVRTKPGTAINGLTPGTVYAFQVRAFSAAGWTEWSAPVTKMST